MAHGYRSLRQWDQWLKDSHPGKSLVQSEQQAFTEMLSRHFGKHALLIGAPNQYNLLTATKIPCHTVLSPFIQPVQEAEYIEGGFKELPILTGSIDLVILPHTLEFVDNPRKLLHEACRIIKPEGLIVITGFNPYSFWGIKKLIGRQKNNSWMGHFNSAQKIKNWLRLADFELEKQQSILFCPPTSNEAFYKQLQLVERLGNQLLPFIAGEYILVARAKVIPLTPIKLKWKQKISGIKISPSISGHIVSQTRQDT